MAKENYTRYSMRENMLRKVLIRIDYDGVTDINKWIVEFKSNDNLSCRFKKYNKGYQNKASFSLANMEDIAESRSIPLSAFQSEPLHHFSDSNFDGRDDRVIMDVSSLFMTLSIDCINYQNLDVYLEFLNAYISAFMANDKYIVINRIGIRKVGGDVFRSLDEFSRTFEDKFFFSQNIDQLNTKMIDREYHDRFIKNDNSVKINFSRRCRAVNTNDGETVFQALLDLDGYVDSSIINSSNLIFPQDLNVVMRSRINDYLFDLYKLSVTEQYLSENGSEVQNK